MKERSCVRHLVLTQPIQFLTFWNVNLKTILHQKGYFLRRDSFNQSPNQPVKKIYFILCIKFVKQYRHHFSFYAFTFGLHNYFRKYNYCTVGCLTFLIIREQFAIKLSLKINSFEGCGKLVDSFFSAFGLLC